MFQYGVEVLHYFFLIQINPPLNKAISLTDTPSRILRRSPHHLQAARSLQERSATIGEENSNQARNSASSPETSSSGGTGGTREEREFVPVELCDIEPLSGTVFRKVTVRRRRQDMRKMAAVDSGEFDGRAVHAVLIVCMEVIY